jgi:hypothetical protein
VILCKELASSIVATTKHWVYKPAKECVRVSFACQVLKVLIVAD